MNALFPILPHQGPVSTKEKTQIKWRQYLKLLTSMTQEGALRKASKQGELDKVAELITKGVNVNGADSEKWTGLHWAAYDGKPAVAMALIEAKADVNAQNQHGETPLHFAAMFGRLEILDALIEAGANVHATIERGVHKGDSALKKAAEKGHADACAALLKAGATVDDRDPAGRTPLHEAARGGHLETVRVLLDAGANVNAKDFVEIRTPLDMAEEFPDVVTLIKNSGGEGEKPECTIC